MPRIVDRYVGGVLIRDSLLAVAGLTALFSVIRLLGELEEVGQGAYTAVRAITFVLLTLPQQGCEMIASASLIGAVLALGGLAARGELVAMLACGIPRARIAAAAFGSAAILALGAASLLEFAAAPLAREAHHRRALALSAGRAASTARGLWMRAGPWFLHAGDVVAGGELREVDLFQIAPDGSLRRFARVASASYKEGKWWLRDGVSVEFSEDGAVRAERLRVDQIGRLVTPKQVATLRLPPEALSARDLIAAIHSLRRRGESARRHEMALLERVATPIDACLLALLAVPVALGVGRRMAGGTRLLGGTLAGVGFQLARDTLARFGLVYGVPPLLLNALPSALLLFAAVMWLRRSP